MILNKINSSKQFRLWHLILLFGILQIFISFLTLNTGFSFDEAIWHYIGRNWFRNHLVPYKGGVDNKSPLIYIIYGISDLLFGINYWFPRLLSIIVQSLGIYYVYRITKHLSGKQAGIIAVTLYGLSLLWHSTNGKMVSTTQTYEITFLIISVYFYLISENRRDFFISGLAAGLAFGFRYSAAFPIIAILLMIVFQKKKVIDGVSFSFGLFVSIILLSLLFILLGINLNDLMIYSLYDNFVPGSITDHSLAWRIEQFSNAFFFSEIILFYPFIITYFIIKKTIDIFILWVITAFLGICVIGMFAFAHLKELLPPLCIISAISVNHITTRYKIPVRAVFLIIWISFFPKTFEPLFALKKHFFTKENNKSEICEPPYQEDEDAKKKLGQWIRENTHPADKVFIAGYGAQIQVYSARVSPTIYFNVTETALAKGKLIEDLTLNKPRLIVIPLSAKYSTLVDSDLQSFINEIVSKFYYLERCIYNYNIYRYKL